MGVIDLDARVKKLEQGGGSIDPTVIDQLEAAVTDLEETVNGDGETDLGLVGDVAALATAVTNVTPIDVSNKFTAHEGITLDTGTTISAIQIGRLVFLSATLDVSAGSQTSPTEYTVLDLDDDIAPEATTVNYCYGQAAAVGKVSVSAVNKTLLVNTGNWARFIIFWILPEPSNS